MVRFAKKAMALFLAVMVVMSSTTAAFAAGSPHAGEGETKAKKTSKINIDENNGTMELVEYHKVNGKTITVPNRAKDVEGNSYKVTSVLSCAFALSPQVTKVIVGKYVTNIGKNAFYGLKNLKTIHLKKTKGVSFKKNAFYGVPKTCVIKVSNKLNKSQYEAVKSALKKAGFKGTVKKATTF